MDSIKSPIQRTRSAPPRLSINRFWVVAPLVLATCVAFAGMWVIRSAETTLKKTLAVKLETVLQVESEAVSAWIESKKRLFGFLSRRLPEGLLNGQIDADPKNSPLFARNLGIEDFCLIAADGKPLAESQEGLVAQLDLGSDLVSGQDDYPQVVFLHRADSGKQSFGSSTGEKSEITMFLIGPCWQAGLRSQPGLVRDENGQSKTERSIPRLAIGFPALKELTRIVRSSRMGRTGETLVFDQSGKLLSLSRFNSGPYANQLIQRTLADGWRKQVDLDGFVDSRGRKVVGASQWNSIFGIGLLTKMDYEEAIAPITNVKRFILILCILLFVAALSLLLFQYLNHRLANQKRQLELQKRKLGMYQLEEKIGEGGMGIVYRAQHQLLTRPTAVKILSPTKSKPEAVRRFEREVQFTSQLKNPNTISIYDYGRTEHGLFYYAMEYVDGLTLDKLVARDGCQTDGQTVHILVQICNSLIEAHEIGLVHRDIKPSNVMICELGGVPDCVKVLDFGMVRDLTSSAHNQNALSGTPCFMPPEALTNKYPVDHRFDIFSIGAVGYFLLTGNHFREYGSLSELIEHCEKWTESRISRNLYRFAQHTGKSISAQLVRIIARCASPNPKDRIASVVELKSQLLACTLNSPWKEEQAAAWWKQIRQAENDAANTVDDSIDAWCLPTVTLDRQDEVEPKGETAGGPMEVEDAFELVGMRDEGVLSDVVSPADDETRIMQLG